MFGQTSRLRSNSNWPPFSKALQVGVSRWKRIKTVGTALLRHQTHIAVPRSRALDFGGTRNGPPKGAVFTTPFFTKALPPIEAVATSALTPTNGNPNEPQNEKDCSRYPQKMHCESGSKKNQNEQERKNQYHGTTSYL